MAAARGAATRTRALLFDFDGTMVHTDHIHFEAWRQFFPKVDIFVSLTEEYFREHVSGRLNEHIIQDHHPEIPTEEAYQLGLQKEALFRKLAAASLTPLPGLTALLDWAKAEGVQACLVTNAPRANVEFMMEVADLNKYFPDNMRVIADEDCENGKPAPDPYLLGLSKVGTVAGETLAFEDSITGAQSAIGAKLRTVGILTTQTDARLREVGTVHNAPHYEDERLLHLIRTGSLD